MRFKAGLWLGDTDYLKVWELDFTSTINRTNYYHLRKIEKEKKIESQITQILREKFYFRFVPLEGQEKRMGKTGIESRLIGTVAQCKICRPSENWLGRYSPKRQINNGKLWLSNYLASAGLSDNDKTDLMIAIKKRDIPSF